MLLFIDPSRLILMDSANKQTNKTFDRGSEGRSVLLWKSKMVKKTSPNIITTPHASFHIVLTKIPGQGFGYETDYVYDKKHSFPFVVSLVHSIVYSV